MLILRNQEEIMRSLETKDLNDPHNLTQNQNVEDLEKFSKSLCDNEIRINTVSCKIIL